MAKWFREVDFREIWKLAEKREITAFECAKQCSEKLKKIKYPEADIQENFEEIIGYFDDFASDKNEDYDDFDNILSDLYDFGDRLYKPGLAFSNNIKMLWVRTF